MATFFLTLLVHVMRVLPLGLLRAIAGGLGWLLYHLASSRRKVGRVNLQLCFPQASLQWRQDTLKQHFVLFLQALFDRFWLWHSAPAVLKKRLRLLGDVDALQEHIPTVVFAPHFLGMDAAGMATALFYPQRTVAALYMPQSNPVIDEWMKKGRNRFPNTLAISRYASPKTIIKTLREGHILYLLPDMDFGRAESVFVPFFKTPAATLSSLGRFAQLGRAQVLTVFATVTPQGYDVHIQREWTDFPTGEPETDARRMNAVLEAHIAKHPAQYYWLHKRFKTRPEGEPSVY